MVQSGSAVKTILENKVFVKPPGSYVTITPISEAKTGSEGGYGGTTKTTGTPVTVIGVPYGYLSGDRKYTSMGINSDGEIRIAIPADTSANEGDSVTITSSDIPSQSFEIISITDYPYNEVNVARIISCKKKI